MEKLGYAAGVSSLYFLLTRLHSLSFDAFFAIGPFSANRSKNGYMLLPFAAHRKHHLVTCDQPYFLDMAYLARFCLKIGLNPILNMIDSNADTNCQLWKPFT